MKDWAVLAFFSKGKETPGEERLIILGAEDRKEQVLTHRCFTEHSAPFCVTTHLAKLLRLKEIKPGESLTWGHAFWTGDVTFSVATCLVSL